VSHFVVHAEVAPSPLCVAQQTSPLAQFAESPHVSVSCPLQLPFAEQVCDAPPPPPPAIVTQQSCVVRSHEDVPHVSDVEVTVPVDPEPPVVDPPPDDPVDPDPDPEDPVADPPEPELDDPPLLDPPGFDPEAPPEPVPSPSTDAIFPPHAIAKKIAANENAFEDFKTNLFLDRTATASKNRHFVARATRFVNEWKVLRRAPFCTPARSSAQRVRT
jgi:hypothetical protein